jgi:CxxC motif-containing protein (DUF1111 family)
MVSLSIRGMTGWVNPFFLAARRPGTLSVLRRRSAGAFFLAQLQQPKAACIGKTRDKRLHSFLNNFDKIRGFDRLEETDAMPKTHAACWATLGLTLLLGVSSQAQTDPGVRPGADAGSMRPGLTPAQQALFREGRVEFMEVEEVEEGLGPRFNLDSCAGCHAQPAVGGTSPSVNPQIAFLTRKGKSDTQLPRFVREDGPMVEIRFQRDETVHQLFAIEEGDCQLKVGPFPPGQVTLRIPTPVFGVGLLEDISDAVILAQMNDVATQPRKQDLGITGRPQQQVGGRIGRFGWKAQHGNVQAFAAEAYNVEMGITNEFQQVELEQDPACQFAEVPNTGPEKGQPSPVELFAGFMRGLAGPTPNPANHPGRAVFDQVGCNFCHTPSLGGVPAFSDLLLHRMGAGLDDSITQLSAEGDQFRTAPLWGLGQRIFFLHDGRTKNLLEAIEAHASRGSEANGVIAEFERVRQQNPDAIQTLLAFLRSL